MKATATDRDRSMPRVFVGSSFESDRVAKAIQNNLQNAAQVNPWYHGSFEVGHHVLEDLIGKAKDSDFGIFVLSPDDVTHSRGVDKSSPRDNTIFEAGLFMGMLGRDRVLLVVPRHPEVKLPSDLAGITLASYDAPSDDRWESALGPATNKVEAAIRRRTRAIQAQEAPAQPGAHHVYPSLKEAADDIRAACQGAEDIKIWANKGLDFIGIDGSIVSTADIPRYSRLRKLRVLLMSEKSRWVAGQPTADGASIKRLITLRKKESLETYLREIRAVHSIVESGFNKFASAIGSSRSAVRYFTGEPCWRMVMTETVAFVSNYADSEDPTSQVRDLPVCRFDNEPRSLYSAFKRQFNDVWHNHSVPAPFMQATIDVTAAAGGIVYADIGGERFVILLCRHDGAWVLPKGHRRHADTSLEETAAREVAEECGLPRESLAVGRLLQTYTDSTSGEHKVVTIFKIRFLGDSLPVPRPDADHAAVKWWRVVEMLPPMLYPYQTIVLAEFVDSYKGRGA
jgi:8-oxo-dGTP pyrophosphatase MutT (NUDIX family)